MSDDHRDRRAAIEIMGWMPGLGAAVGLSEGHWLKLENGNWSPIMPIESYQPTIYAEQCDEVVRKMQAAGWEYRRGGSNHVFYHDASELIETFPLDELNGFDCPGVINAALRARELGLGNPAIERAIERTETIEELRRVVVQLSAKAGYDASELIVKCRRLFG